MGQYAEALVDMSHFRQAPRGVGSALQLGHFTALMRRRQQWPL